ncbi:MAG: O-antigen ligase family protein, partial [Anaerolineales bacterium]
MSGDFVKNRWFPLVDLACVGLSGAIWYNRPDFGWQPLLIALAPWVMRLAAGRFPFRRTIFDLPLALSLLTALVGVWVVYDRAAAWAKFWLILDGVLLYYALAGQPKENLWLVIGLLGLFGVGIAGYFLLTHNWNDAPAKFGVLNRIGLRWMAIRPAIPTHILHPNVAAGIMVLVSPFLVAAGLCSWQKRRFGYLIAASLGGGLLMAGLLLTTSRGAWLALTTAMGVWVLWGVSGKAGQISPLQMRKVFSAALIFLLVLGVGYVFSYPGGVKAFVNRLPGPSNVGSRVDLVRSLVELIGDYPITGSGLDSFPGLYSQYILVRHSLMLDHGHNLFLDVTLEQGITGSLSLAVVLLGTGWLVAKQIWKVDTSSQQRIMLWATLTSLLVLLFHGMVDDILYGSRAPLLLFLPAGVGAAVLGVEPPVWGWGSGKRAWLAGIAAFLLVAVGGFFVFRKPLLARWYANLGAMEMTRIELDGWPPGKMAFVGLVGYPPWEPYDADGDIRALGQTEKLFNRALELDPDNRTVHHRLGRIAAARGDFEAAVFHLENASQVDPDHRGIRKMLAYSYLWNGQFARSFELLDQIPEAERELETYTWSWKQRGRSEFSVWAGKMLNRLTGIPLDTGQPASQRKVQKSGGW